MNIYYFIINAHFQVNENKKKKKNKFIVENRTLKESEKFFKCYQVDLYFDATNFKI